MKRVLRRAFAGAVGLSLLAAIAARANPVTVIEQGMGQNEIVSITSSTLGGPWWVYAGINILSVNGIVTDGFCIDPYHWNLSGPDPNYSSIDLASAPKTPGGPMGPDAANLIGKLWALNFSPTMSAAAAAGLQIAIWEVVSRAIPANSGSFTLNGPSDYGAAGLIAAAKGANIAPAYLSALTGPGQDYVIPGVPDGGTTAMLLGLALLGLLPLHQKRITGWIRR